MQVIKGHIAFKRCLKLIPKGSRVLDYGCGEGLASNMFAEAGMEVVGVDIDKTPANLHNNVTYMSSYSPGEISGDYNLIWCSHVLEHVPDPHTFLKQLLSKGEPSGYTCITVPPMKPEIVGGHLNLYNAGILMYQMILAGWDVSECMVKSYGYNISIITKNTPRPPEVLCYDNGDIQTLSKYFPKGYNYHGFNGSIKEHNWE